jgi:hypothetical protein
VLILISSLLRSLVFPLFGLSEVRTVGSMLRFALFFKLNLKYNWINHIHSIRRLHSWIVYKQIASVTYGIFKRLFRWYLLQSLEVLNEGVKIVNFSDGCSLIKWCFKIFYSETGANPTHLSYHIEVCWLSCSKILTIWSSDDSWKIKLTCSSYIFSVFHYHELNVQKHSNLLDTCYSVLLIITIFLLLITVYK